MRPCPRGIERDPLTIRRTVGIESILNQFCFFLRRQINCPDIAVSERSENVAGFELNPGPLRPDKKDGPAFRRPGRLNVVIISFSDSALFARSNVLNEDASDACLFTAECEFCAV